MKKILLSLLFLLAFQINFSQNTYSVNGESIDLKTEVDGKLDLLWNTFDGVYRYFVRTDDGQIIELTNTKGSDNKYQEEYKSTLENLTNGLSTSKLKLTVYDLKKYIDSYNVSVDSAYKSVQKESKIGLRLGFSGGVTNNPFANNPDNKITPLLGAELEVFEENLKNVF